MSLRLRLALWYGGLTGLLVLFVCAYSYAVHSRAHYDEIDAALASSAEHVAVELSAVSTPAARAGLLHASQLLGSAMRIYGADGVLRVQTESGASAPAVDLRELRAGAPPPYPPVARLAPPLHLGRRLHGTFGLVPGSPRWRLYLLPISGGAEYLVAAAPLDMIDRSVGRFAQIMVVMAAVGTALTFLVGWLLAAHALRPVALLTETAGAIARSGEFSRRVPTEATEVTGDELERLAATFNEMLGSLEQAYLLQQRFVSDASHELRAPLTAIQANLELLRDQADMPAVERQLATREAAREADRLARLVADLLVLARADAGMPLRCQFVELDRLLMDVVGEARFLVRGQQLEIGTLDPCAMEGDPDRLKQLLLIFVDNAIKYTPSDGQVRLSLRREKDTAAFTVEDTGVGIPPDALPRVFERFYRADGARSRDPGGTGLGLSIARWIAAQHGGSVHLDSKMGRGTTATAILPLRP
ncbi:MAG: sensor histidine kinase [Gemmatimonadaceae bacterium]